MKTLNLEQMGVQEMDAKEVKEVDGGGQYPRGIDSGVTSDGAGYSLGLLVGFVMGLFGQ